MKAATRSSAPMTARNQKRKTPEQDDEGRDDPGQEPPGAQVAVAVEVEADLAAGQHREEQAVQIRVLSWPPLRAWAAK